MKIAYQVSTPEVRRAPGVTAYQETLPVAFRRLAEVGYRGAELMVADPCRVDAGLVARLGRVYGLEIPMVCTGEVFGQDKVSFSDPDDAVRKEAIRRVKDAIDLAQRLNAQINIGRVRGGIVPGLPREASYRRILDAFLEISDYAGRKKVIVALEPVNTLAINFINSTREGLDMVAEVGRPAFKLMLDSAHMFIEDPDMDAAIRDAAGVFTYVHLCDSNRKYPGHCKIDFARFLLALRLSGYDGFVGIEVFQVPDQDTALEKSFQHIHRLLNTDAD